MFFHTNSKSKFLSLDGETSAKGKGSSSEGTTTGVETIVSLPEQRPSTSTSSKPVTTSTISVDEEVLSKPVENTETMMSKRPTAVTLAIDQVNLLDPIPIAQSIAARQPLSTGGGAFGGGVGGGIGSETDESPVNKKSYWWLWLALAGGGAFAYYKMK